MSICICISFVVMTSYLVSHCSILPEKELHRNLQVEFCLGIEVVTTFDRFLLRKCVGLSRDEEDLTRIVAVEFCALQPGVSFVQR